MICNVACSGALMLVGGAVTDRWSPRRVMMCSHLAKGVLVSGLCVLASAHAVDIWACFAIAAAFGIADSFFWPASGSILPSLVSAEELPRANAIVAVGEQTALFLGPVVGVLLVSAFSPAPVFALDAVTFFAAAWTVTLAPRASAGSTAADEWSVRSLVASVTAGFTYARGKPDVRSVLVLVAAATLAYSGLFAVALPAFAHALCRGAMLGRVNSIINLPRVLLPPVSIAVMGALAVVSIRLPFFFAAAPMLLAGAALAAAGTTRQLAMNARADSQPAAEGRA
jgi:MFS family permease